MYIIFHLNEYGQIKNIPLKSNQGMPSATFLSFNIRIHNLSTLVPDFNLMLYAMHQTKPFNIVRILSSIETIYIV